MTVAVVSGETALFSDSPDQYAAIRRTDPLLCGQGRDSADLVRTRAGHDQRPYRPIGGKSRRAEGITQDVRRDHAVDRRSAVGGPYRGVVVATSVERPGHGSGLLRSSRLNNEFRKIDGVWKITRTRTANVFIAPLPTHFASDHLRATPMVGMQGVRTNWAAYTIVEPVDRQNNREFPYRT